MALHHFYHAYVATPRGEKILAQHEEALQDSGLRDALTTYSKYCVTGGWEQQTLEILHLFCKGLVMNGAGNDCVMYAHTKGAAVPTQWNHAWRQGMTFGVVHRWNDCVSSINSGEADVAGCHWLTPEVYPGMVTKPFFGGNFWWARVSYIADLPQINCESRYDAEAWIGLGDPLPRVYDMAPGWPGYETILESITNHPKRIFR